MAGETTDKQPTEEELRAAEEAGFNAQAESLYPQPEPSPLEEGGAEEENELQQELEGATSEQEVQKTVEKFLGDYTAEEVLEKLNGIDAIPDSVSERVMSRVFGKFGEVNQQLKALQDKELKFNPEKLAKLKEIDEDIYAALTEGLAGAFEGNTFDRDAVTADIETAVTKTVSQRYEQRFLDFAVPNAGELAQTDEFRDWFYKVAAEDVREAFRNWDAGENMDGLAMANAFKGFQDWNAAEKAKADGKKQEVDDAVKRSVETPTSSPAPAPRRHMNEDEAFAARAKELKR